MKEMMMITMEGKWSGTWKRNAGCRDSPVGASLERLGRLKKDWRAMAGTCRLPLDGTQWRLDKNVHDLYSKPNTRVYVYVYAYVYVYVYIMVKGELLGKRALVFWRGVEACEKLEKIGNVCKGFCLIKQMVNDDCGVWFQYLNLK